MDCDCVCLVMTDSADTTTRMSTERQIKKLKKILKDNKGGPFTLKEACARFNEIIGIQDAKDSTLFLQRLWDLKRKTTVFR